jgi:hypothetical protein
LIFDKRAQYVQLALTIVVLFVFVIIAVFVYQASSQINDAIQVDDSMSVESKETLDSINTSYPSVFDGIGMFVFVGLWIFSLVLAYYSSSNTVMIFISLFVIAALAIVGMVLNNVWVSVYDDADTGSFAASFPMMNFIFSNYLLVVIVMGVTTLIVGVTRGGGF